MYNVLVIDATEAYRVFISDLVEEKGARAQVAKNFSEVEKTINMDEIDLVVVDMDFGSRIELEKVMNLKIGRPWLKFLVLSEKKFFVNAENMGNVSFLKKPFDSNSFYNFLRRVIARKN